MSLSLRKHQSALGEALRHGFDTLELDQRTGQGDITAESALEAWHNLKVSTIAPSLARFNLCRFHERPPTQPVRWVSDLLTKLGLHLVSRREGGRGEQLRIYSIDPGSWETMTAIYPRRRAARCGNQRLPGSQQEGFYINTSPAGYGGAPARG